MHIQKCSSFITILSCLLHAFVYICVEINLIFSFFLYCKSKGEAEKGNVNKSTIRIGKNGKFCESSGFYRHCESSDKSKMKLKKENRHFNR